MLFNSLQFLVFFPVVALFFFTLPQRLRWGLLVLASYIFYGAWDWRFLGLILLSTVIDYVVALRIQASDVPRKRKLWLLVSLAGNLGVLGYFKYASFFADSLARLLALQGPLPSWVADVALPVGISFYTFQTLSYTIDVYRRQMEAERHFGIFALYVSFFPQLVAGPIERSTRLLPQFREHQAFDWERARAGLTLMGWGFFKKLVIADRLAVYVDTVYADTGAYPGLPMLVATYFFAIQVYCDFSGYSDIAVGTARVMGFELMENFRRPYLAATFRDFWARWHISLTTWFRDYVYIPMGGSRCSRARAQWNLFATFTLCGLWHGARWNCVLWGAVNGVYLVVGAVTGPLRERLARLTGLARLPLLRRVLAVLITFHLFTFSLMIYRSDTLPLMVYNLGQLVTFDERFFDVTAPMSGYELHLALVSLAFLLLLELVQERKGSTLVAELERRPAWLRWPVYYATVFAILLFGEFSLVPFVYFRF